MWNVTLRYVINSDLFKEIFKSEKRGVKNAIWKAYLTPALISSRTSTNTTSDSYGVFGYQPNLMARQFGLIQTCCSSFIKTKDIKRPKNEQQWQTYLHEFSNIVPKFKPLHIEISYECTKSFFNWWWGYLSGICIGCIVAKTNILDCVSWNQCSNMCLGIFVRCWIRCSNILARFTVLGFMPICTRALYCLRKQYFLILLTKQRTYLYKISCGIFLKFVIIF